MSARWAVALALLWLPAAARAAGSMSVSEELDAEYGYVGGAITRGSGLTGHSVDEHSADVRFVVSPQITRDWLWRFGLEWQRFTFGVPAHVPVPDVLQQASAVIGFDFQLADQWLMRAEVEPGRYSDFRDVSWRDVDAPLVLGGVYLVEPDLQWFFGLRMDVRTRFPVLPAAGVRWRFSDDWTLNLLFPKPRLEYALNDSCLFYLGADIVAGTFRVGERFGTDRGWPKLNGELVDFLEFRGGPGVSWKIRPNLTLEAEGGWMPYREFVFNHVDVTFRSHNAPYAQIALHARF